jgi:hypothetical protein
MAGMEAKTGGADLMVKNRAREFRAVFVFVCSLRARVTSTITILALGFALSGCAAYNPSVPQCMPDTDRAIFECGVSVRNFYVARSAKAKVLGTSGAIGMAGLSAAGVAMVQGGASAAALATVGTVGNFVGQALGIVEPTERANAYDDGSNDMLKVLADYLDATTPDETTVKKVSPDGYTRFGAVLLRKIGAVIYAVDTQLKTMRPTQATLDLIAAKFNDLVKPKTPPPAPAAAAPQGAPQ